MHAGWDRHLGSDRFVGKDDKGVFHFPGFHPETVEFLIKERRVAGIAVDTLSLDHGPSKDFKTHYAWLPSGRWGLENVANLGRLPPRGATLIVGAPKIKGATGGPTRVLALS
jgi:kynurenine formamidase